jgi:hypothetical protein
VERGSVPSISTSVRCLRLCKMDLLKTVLNHRLSPAALPASADSSFPFRLFRDASHASKRDANVLVPSSLHPASTAPTCRGRLQGRNSCSPGGLRLPRIDLLCRMPIEACAFVAFADACTATCGVRRLSSVVGPPAGGRVTRGCDSAPSPRSDSAKVCPGSPVPTSPPRVVWRGPTVIYLKNGYVSKP